MLEKLKSLLLICLILLSMVLTYQLWFGRPPLEKGTVPRYEYAYFTPPPLLSEVVQPSEIIFLGQEDIYLFHRGEKEYLGLWGKGLQLLTERLEFENAKRVSKESKDDWLKTAPLTLVYNFNPPVPLECMARAPANLHMDLERIMFSWDEEHLDVFLEGEEIVCIPVKGVTDLQEDFFPVEKKPYMLLPSLLVLDVPGNVKIFENTVRTGDFHGDIKMEQSPGDLDFLLNLKINVTADIYIPLEDIWAAEVSLRKEDLQREQLVRAFFLDLSMARRIEERDGALYFTNGEKGLRIYPSGLLEYTAPRLERTQSTMSYSAALQKSAESQSLYGGWLPNTYLYEAKKVEGGYRFLWRSFQDGFVLEGENTGSEMLINEQGVSFYRRFFYTFGEEISERRPFRPYKEAIARALVLKKEQLKGEKVTLLSLKPVYYLPGGKKTEKAIPAWSVNFAETGVVYLHWHTLEPL